MSRRRKAKKYKPNRSPTQPLRANQFMLGSPHPSPPPYESTEEDDRDAGDEPEEEYLDYNYSTPGTAPGTLNIPRDALPTELVLIDYSLEAAKRYVATSPMELRRDLQRDSVSWLDVRGLGTEAMLHGVGDLVKLHPLVLEDVVNVPHRPKIDMYPEHVLIILRMVRPRFSGQGFTTEQVSFVLNSQALVTFQEEPHWDSFNPVRDRITRNVGTIRRQGPDYLMYALIDTIIDGFFPVLEELGEYIETLEDEVVSNPTQDTIEKIHDLRRQLMMLRRAIWPQRSVLNSLIRDSNDLISPEIRIYFQDCYDHIIQVLDILETYREIASSLMDVYLSSLSNRMNEVMKLLTVMSSIFIPLTFIAGVYGMNFNPQASPWNMPELEWRWGYVACLLVMGAIASGLIVFFWKRGWFENFSTTRR